MRRISIKPTADAPTADAPTAGVQARAKRMVTVFRSLTEAGQCRVGISLALLGEDEMFTDAEAMRQAVFTRAAERGKTIALEQAVLAASGIAAPSEASSGNRHARRAAKKLGRR